MSSIYNGTNSYPTGMTIPDDGDPRNAASANVALEALADRTTYLKTRLDPITLSNLVLVQWKSIRFEDVSETETGHGSPVTTAAWASFGGFTSPPTIVTAVGDVVEAVVQAHALIQDSGSGTSRGWIQFEGNQNGTGAVAVPGSKVQMGQNLASAVMVVPFTLVSLDIVTAAGSYAGSLRGRVNADAAASLQWQGAYTVAYKVWRPQ
jgi:hypothetical protein